MKGDEHRSDFAKKYIAEWGGEGPAERRAREVAEGRVEGTARGLLTALRARSITVPESARVRILAQKDPEQLTSWLEKAVVATSLAEVLGEEASETGRQALEALIRDYDHKRDFAKKYLEQGFDEARKRASEWGRVQGYNEGMRTLLLRMLRSRFGELPESVVARVESAEVAVLERWGDRVLSATTLAEVLDEPS